MTVGGPARLAHLVVLVAFVGNWPLPGTRTAQNAFLLVALFMNARLAIQFGVTHFLEIGRVCTRVLTASASMRLSRPGSPQTDDFPFIPVLTDGSGSDFRAPAESIGLLKPETLAARRA